MLSLLRHCLIQCNISVPRSIKAFIHEYYRATTGSQKATLRATVQWLERFHAVICYISKWGFSSVLRFALYMTASAKSASYLLGRTSWGSCCNWINPAGLICISVRLVLDQRIKMLISRLQIKSKYITVSEALAPPSKKALGLNLVCMFSVFVWVPSVFRPIRDMNLGFNWLF